ncbi:uncharacterized protein LOC122060107 [Macadamia integrifolia]|uniref:uncharacterized protein LOC122060107 n=1 Tax=Macadamia integrifolia TaxID=60698 RepID=UPI001C5334E4|nr:uncharacterized protein LOC122060107 [Macadamia integrifolia]
MALSFSTAVFSSKQQYNLNPPSKYLNIRIQTPHIVSRCESSESKFPEKQSEFPKRNSKLQIGSPIVFVEAPEYIKTAASMPCLRVNTGLVKPGDVGRIVARKPKDVWVVRLAIGTYLIDGKHFRPLDLDD